MDGFNFDLNPEERLIKARVQLQKEKPFFSFLTMQLKFIEVPDMLKNEAGGIGIDKYGNLYYDPIYIGKMTDDELKGSLCHEVMHCALEHLVRCNGREPQLFNISSDIVINNMIIKDGMSLPSNVYVPRYGNIEVFGVKLKNLDDKTSEEVYDKLWRKLSKDHKKQLKAMKKFLDGLGDKGFDVHYYDDGKGKGKDGKGKSKGIKTGSNGQKPNDKEVNWKKALIDACTHARQRGNLPAGMERIVGKLLETYIDWRGLLYRYITSQIPIDYTWARPSKRSFSLGYYLPAVEKETLDVMVAVDTSGSISDKELAKFLSEISSIVNSFKNVELTVIDCDCRVNGIHQMRNATVSDVMSKIKLKGGGGTSHIPVFDWINKNKPNSKFVIAFTDGYTEFPDKSQVKMPVLWVLAGDWRTSKDKFPYGKVIELPKTRDD